MSAPVSRRSMLRGSLLLASVAIPLLAACSAAPAAAPTATSAPAAPPAAPPTAAPPTPAPQPTTAAAPTAVPTPVATTAPTGIATATPEAAAASSGLAQTQETTWYFSRGLHPYWSPSRDNDLGMYAGELVFGGLLTVDEKANPLPYAAESWSSSSDGLVWTFKLRNDLKYAPTGRPVQAIDVKKSLEFSICNMLPWDAPTYFFFVNGATDAQTAAKAKTKPGDVAQPIDIPGFVAKSDLEFEVHCSQPAPALIPYAAAGSLSSWAIADPEQLIKDTPTKRWNADGGGSIGPYMIQSYDDQTGDTTLVRNPYYVLGKKPILDTIHVKNIKDGQTALVGYQGGSADYFNPVASADAKQMVGASNSELHLRPQALFSWWPFNLSQEPFDDANLRKAFCLSIDWQKLKAATFGALGDWPTSIMPAGPYHRDDVFPKLYTYDPTGAQAAFKQSRYAGDPKKVPPPTVWVSTSNPDGILWTQIVQQMVKDTLGLNLSILSKDSLAQNEWRGVHIYQTAWGTATVDPSEWTRIINGADYTTNKWGEPPDELANGWVKTINTEVDEAKRKAAWFAAEDYIANNYLIIPGGNLPVTDLEKSWLKGITLAPNWYWIKTNEIFLAAH